MGFCRRCGEIVTGPRCKCGGSSVAPVVPWNHGGKTSAAAPDRWSKTYVATRDRERSPTRSASATTTAPSPPTARTPAPTTSTTTTGRRFPRPMSRSFSGASPGLEKGVTAHITSTTASRPASPLKQTTVVSPEEDILPALHARDGSLAKVYGSVLQPKESLQTHSCAICAAPFPPDTTIYPDPSSPTNSFLCRECFESNGGSKGACAACSRPVLALKSEGGFVQAANQIWHKRCFTCESCYKYIGDTPMVDLLGRPSCAECFDNCLAKERTPRRVRNSHPGTGNNSPSVAIPADSNALGSKPGSPTINELEHRLGISKGRESSPELEELTQRLNKFAGGASPTKSPRYSSGLDFDSPNAKSMVNSREGSPLVSRVRKDSNRIFPTSPEVERGTRPRYSSTSSARQGSPSPDRDAIEEMKRRFMRSSISSSPDVAASPSPTRSPLRHAPSSGSMSVLPSSPTPASPTVSSTPDLDTLSETSSRSATSPPPPPPPPPPPVARYTPKRVSIEQPSSPTPFRSRLDSFEDRDVIPEETPSQTTTPTRPLRPKSHTFSASPLQRTLSGRSPARADAGATGGSKCAKCSKALFSIASEGRAVTIPDESGGGRAKSYHYACFRCAVCDEAFEEGANGQAIFVKSADGACHMDCVAPTKVTMKTVSSPARVVIPPPTRPLNISPKSSSTTTKINTKINTTVSSRYERPKTAPSTPAASSPRFGGSIACPGCHKAVAIMERGVVPGPQGTKWHASCLVCGGKKPPVDPWARGRPERRKDEPGCGKKLDSAAKTDADGGVWCRECLLLLPRDTPSAPSPTKETQPSSIVQQMTGTTTLARQFTGLGGPSNSSSTAQDGALLRQMTGGGLNRSVSPSKQVGMGMPRPRPKSVIGSRSSKSVDEGRGMFLVRQMTGGGGL